MRVAVRFSKRDADIIDCPKEIIGNLQEHRDNFLKWIFNKDNDHSYWWYENGEKIGCSYRSEAYVEWLNNYVCNNSPSKVNVLERCVSKWDRKLPSVFF